MVRPPFYWSACCALLLGSASSLKGEARPLFRGERTAALRPFAGKPAESTHTVQPDAVKAPEQFNPDPGKGKVETVRGSSPSVSAPAQKPSPASLFLDFPLLFPDPQAPPDRGPQSPDVPGGLALPRSGVRARKPLLDKYYHYREYPGDRGGYGLQPNTEVVRNRWLMPFPGWKRYQDPSHEAAYGYNVRPGAVGRTGAPTAPTDKAKTGEADIVGDDSTRLWHPYEPSTLKGDVPIFGQDIFLNLTAKNFTLLEFRKLPVPSGISTATVNSGEFFGRSTQAQISNDASFAFELFKGETAFKPVHWSLRGQVVYNNNWVWVRENGLLDPDPRGPGYTDDKPAPNTREIEAVLPIRGNVNPRDGVPAPFVRDIRPGDMFNYLAPQLRPVGDAQPLQPVDPLTNEIPDGRGNDDNDGPRRERKENRRKDFAGSRYTMRHKDHVALQEAFAEIHFSDLSDNYDFISSRTGIQPFCSDFRGFIFADTNLGFRLFGNLDNNRIQYNLALFNMREKDTYSDLNTFESRHQRVFIANAFRQDFIWKGYTAQASVHINLDDGGTHYDKNDALTRTQNFGSIQRDDDSFDTIKQKNVRALYLGWTGDGHIGRMNITHAFYQVLGEDEFNQLAGRRVDINAQMAALELSYDRDWIRFKASGFYASGDDEPLDRTAKGFDTILDNPFFIGGPFSWYVHQGFNLGGTGVNLKQRDSLVTNLRSSKTEGQANFVNPGVLIAGVGTDMDLTPKLRAFINANYIWFAETKPLELALQTNKLRTELGLDASLGFKFRPLLTDNIILSAGIGFFVPGAGYRDIYRRSTEKVPGFGPQEEEGKTDPFLYNGFLTLTLLY